MQTDVLYGFQEGDLEAVRTAVEQALGIALDRHTSVYRGEHYVGVAVGAATLVLQRNWDPFDGELMEEQFPDMRVLLYITASDRAAELEQLLAAQTAAHVLLRQEPLE
jgi:hypothetical protein